MFVKTEGMRELAWEDSDPPCSASYSSSSVPLEPEEITTTPDPITTPDPTTTPEPTTTTYDPITESTPVPTAEPITETIRAPTPVPTPGPTLEPTECGITCRPEEKCVLQDGFWTCVCNPDLSVSGE